MTKIKITLCSQVKEEKGEREVNVTCHKQVLQLPYLDRMVHFTFCHVPVAKLPGGQVPA